MKSIIYISIGLFSVASVYGIADYYKSNKNGIVQQLYQETVPTPTPEVMKPVKQKEPVISTTVNEDVAFVNHNADVKMKKKSFTKKDKIKKLTISIDNFFEDVIPESDITTSEKETKEEKPEEKKMESADNLKIDLKKVNWEMFSRAPLPIKKNTIISSTSDTKTE